MKRPVKEDFYKKYPNLDKVKVLSIYTDKLSIYVDKLENYFKMIKAIELKLSSILNIKITYDKFPTNQEIAKYLLKFQKSKMSINLYIDKYGILSHTWIDISKIQNKILVFNYKYPDLEQVNLIDFDLEFYLNAVKFRVELF